MKAEFENKLIEKYRELFPPDDIWHDETKSCMAWGLAVGDGWYDILDRAFAKFMLLENKPQLAQVKEKFGTLRLYLDNSSDEAYEIASKAEYESETTCEICGKTGKLVGVGWYSTRCEDHKNGYKSAIS